jgi:hypothetical protein
MDIKVLLAVLILTLIVVFLCYLFTAIDSWYLPKESGVGMVVGKTFRLGWTQTVPIFNGSTTFVPIHHPDRWGLTLQVRGRTGWVEVSPAYYRGRRRNEAVPVEYASGRISGSLYIRSVG